MRRSPVASASPTAIDSRESLPTPPPMTHQSRALCVPLLFPLEPRMDIELGEDVSEAPQGDSAPARVLTFHLGPDRYAVGAGYSRRIVQPRPLTRVPGAPAFLPGLINLHGRLAPVIDLARLLGLDAPSEPAQGGMIVIEADEILAALWVGRPGEVIEIPSSASHPCPGRIPPSILSYAEALALIDGSPLLLLDAPSILREARRLLAADPAL